MRVLGEEEHHHFDRGLPSKMMMKSGDRMLGVWAWECRWVRGRALQTKVLEFHLACGCRRNVKKMEEELGLYW